MPNLTYYKQRIKDFNFGIKREQRKKHPDEFHINKLEKAIDDCYRQIRRIRAERSQKKNKK